MQRQAPRAASRLFSAAVERSRLPQSWKSKATSFRDGSYGGSGGSGGGGGGGNAQVDRQGMTLKRLGRVGVVEIASSMVSRSVGLVVWGGRRRTI